MDSKQLLSVSSAWEEHTYLLEQVCPCGGDYKSLWWELAPQNGRQLEVAHAKCTSCESETEFWFDVTAAFESYEQGTNHIRRAWPVPTDGPYKIHEKEYRESAASILSQSAADLLNQEGSDRHLKAILDKYFPKIAGRFQVHGFRRGSMGTTYLCVDLEWCPASSLPYFVICKIVESPSDDLRIEALKSEARIWSELDAHPNIVQLYDVIAVSPSRLVLVMEAILPGPFGATTLKEWIDAGLIELPLALRFFRTLCKAMTHCQLRIPGFVHGDVKPENLLVATGHVVKVTDLGLARAVGFHKPFAGRMVGTPLYLAPECWEGEEPSEKSDVYAAGMIGYEMLAGKPPFECENLEELKTLHSERSVPSLSDPLIPATIRSLLGQCLAKDACQRPTFHDLLNALDVNDVELSSQVISRTAAQWNNQGKALAQLGHHPEAIDCYLRAVSLEPSHPTGWNNFAISLSILGYNSRAEKAYSLSLALGGVSAETFANYASHLLRAGDAARIEEALSLCEKCLQLDSQNLLGLINKAAVLNSLERYSEAIEVAIRATEIDPGHPDGWLELGTAYWKVGRRSKALRCARKAAKLDPTFGPAQALKRLVDTNR
jgi:serine/threonine protein kinase